MVANATMFTPLTEEEQTDLQDASAQAAGGCDESSDAEKAEISQRLWTEAMPEDPLIDAYLTGERGIPKPPGGWGETLRLHPSLPYSFTAGRPYRAVMMRKTSPAGDVVGLHAIFLDADGRKALFQDPRKSAKKSFGRGGVVVLRAGGPLRLGGEGPEDMATVLAACPNATVICTAGAGTLPRIADHVTGDGDVVVLVADRDDTGLKNVGKTAALLTECGVVVSVAMPPEGIKDANALLKAHGLDAVRAMVDAATPWGRPEGADAADADQFASCPDPEDTVGGEQTSPRRVGRPWPFRLGPDGVARFVADTKGNGRWEWVCSPLEVVAVARNADSEDWCRVVHVTDRDGRVHEWAMPMTMLAGDGIACRSELMRLGLEPSVAPKAWPWLKEYLVDAWPDATARCVSRFGWHGRAFVLPDGPIGETGGERVVLQTACGLDHAFKVRGTLGGWQKRIGRLAVGNSRLIIGLCTAFAAPLLRPTNAESGGFHLRGRSSSGKTTLLHVAGSVWGGGGVNGYPQTWRATDNGLEAVAAIHCDALLVLDELAQVDAKVAGAVSYMLANGRGKARAGRSGEGRPVHEWRLLFLSSGEISLAAKVAEDGRGRKATAGMEVRVIDLPSDAGAQLGVFEELHGLGSADALARALRTACAEEFGTAARAFLREVTADPEGVAAAAIKHRDEFVAVYCPADADGQVRRAADRFGVVAAAGEIAAVAGVLPWPPGEATRGVAQCFEAWLAARGGVEAAEVMAGIAQVRAFIEAHGSSRFEAVWEGESSDVVDRRVRDRVGFRRQVADGDENRWDYFILPEAWKTEVCRGYDAGMLAEAMIARGLLLPARDGVHTAKAMQVPGYKKMRLYHVPAAILDGGDHA